MPGRGDIRAGRAFVELNLRDKKFLSGLKRAVRRLALFGAAAAGAAAAVGATALKRFAAFGDQLDKMSKRTGVGVESLAELGFAAEQSGASIDTVEKGFAGLSRALFDAERGSAEVTDSLAAIGLSVEDLKGLSPEEQFERVADGINGLADASKRGAVAQKLLGRSGRELLPMFNDMRALRKEARELGLVLTDDQVEAAAAVTDAMNRISRAFTAIRMQIGAALAPAFISMADHITEFAKAVREFAQENPIAKAFSAGDWALAGNIALLGLKVSVLEGLEALNQATGGWADTFVGMFRDAFSVVTFAAENWRALLEVAVTSAGVSILAFAGEVAHTFTVRIPTLLRFVWENWRDIFTDIANFTKTVATNIGSNLKSLWDGIVSLFSGEGFTFEWTPLTEGFESAIKELPKIAEREMGTLEKSMRDRLAELTGQLGKEFKRHDAKISRPSISGLADEARAELGTLAAQADALKRAADERRGEGEEEEGLQKMRGRSPFGTFSAAALQARGMGGFGGNPQLEEARKTNRHLKESNKKLSKLDDGIHRLRREVERGGVVT